MSDITEKKMKINMKIRPFKKYNPPQSNNPFLPPLWFSMLSSSAKNSGKTYNVIQLLTAYENSGFTQDGEECIMRTIWFSGSTATSKNNAIIRTLKSLADEDIHNIDSGSIGILKEVYDECLKEKQDIEKYVEYEETYNKWKKVGEDKLDALELLILDEKDFENPKKLQDKPKYKRPRVVFMIWDDVLGNPLIFSYRKDNFINKTIIKHRHDAEDLVPMNMILISQNFKSVSTIVRKNCDLFVLLKNANKKKLLENIENEVGGVVSLKDLEKLYDHAMKEEYGALVVSIHPADKVRFRLSWDRELTLNDLPCDCVSRGKKEGSCGKPVKKLI
jgi:hypothetical protein